MGCQSNAGLPPALNFAGTHLNTWVEKDAVRVKCLAQEQHTMSPARAGTLTAPESSALTAPPTRGTIYSAA